MAAVLISGTPTKLYNIPFTYERTYKTNQDIVITSFLHVYQNLNKVISKITCTCTSLFSCSNNSLSI